MYDLYGHCDAFVQCSRAECFGIAQLQAAYCKTPVIYTNWSSQREVMDSDNPGMHPVNDYELEKPSPETQYMQFEGGNDFPPDSNWAVPSLEAIQEQMRSVFETGDQELKQQGQQAHEYVVNNFQWSNKIEPRIEAIKKQGEDL